MSEIIKFRDHDFHVYCDLFKTEMKKGQSQPNDRDIKNIHNFLDKTGRNGVMIDVGAHIGLFSVLYSHLFEKIYSFEPNVKTFKHLLKNLGLNGVVNVTAYNNAVTDYRKMVDCISFGSPKNSGTFKIVDGSKIKAIKLDDWFLDQKIDFIKIDTETSDFDVLRGAEYILKNSKPFLQIETVVPKCHGYLSKLGYKLIDKHGDKYYATS